MSQRVKPGAVFHYTCCKTEFRKQYSKLIQGIFSCFAAQSFADVIHTIDPFDISDEGTTMTYSVESNFNYNVSICPEGHKIVSHKTTSDEFFKNNKNEVAN